MNALTHNEALCLEYSDRSNAPRYLNYYASRFHTDSDGEQVVEAHKGARCIAYAKDGILYRTVVQGPVITDTNFSPVTA